MFNAAYFALAASKSFGTASFQGYSIPSLAMSEFQLSSRSKSC